MSTFSQLNFKHGAAKLQSASSSLLCLTSNDGGELLVQSATTGKWMPLTLSPAGLNQELFNNTACVEGVPNKSLSPNTLYSVYIKNLDGTEAGCKMDFYRTFAGFNPGIDISGIYIGNTGGPNIGLTYVGQVFTGNNDISTIIGPCPNMRQPVYSHFNPWTFGFQSTSVIIPNFTQANNGPTGPSILTVTEGISESPEFTALCGTYALTLPQTIEFYIEVSGMSITGPWSSRSPSQYFTCNHTSSWFTMVANWMSAPPIGVYTARPVIKLLNPGTCYISTSILGKLTL